LVHVVDDSIPGVAAFAAWLHAWAAKGQKMIRSAILAILLLSSAAAAMRLNPLAISDMVDDRRAVFVPIPSRGEIPRPIPVGLKPWPTPEPPYDNSWGSRARNPITIAIR
jgi:hypothetical protein